MEGFSRVPSYREQGCILEEAFNKSIKLNSTSKILKIANILKGLLLFQNFPHSLSVF